MQYMVGSVPYVNAKPLVSRFELLGEESPVKVLYRLPSQLPILLDTGIVQAVLVSTFDALRAPNRRIAGGCVSTYNEAQSVRIFSKVPFDQIRTIALDTSSLTSVHLAQVVLIENYGVKVRPLAMAPDLSAMLNEADAAVLIGDIGMLADGSSLRVSDLGDEWRKLSDLPFVWAAWIGADGLTEELASHLEEANEWGQEHIEEVARETQAEVNWPGEACHDYLTRIMNYSLTDRHIEGLRFFQQLLLKHGYLNEDHFPRVIRATVETSS